MNGGMDKGGRNENQWKKWNGFKLIGETRWLANSNAARAIFGRYDGPDRDAFIDLLTCLLTISESDKFDPETKHVTKCLLESFTSFETCLTAFIFLEVFETTTPASLYLHTKGLNMLTAFKTVDEATRFLKKELREFEKIYAQTEKFVSEVNDLLLPREIELTLTDKLRSNRKRRTPRFHDEMAAD